MPITPASYDRRIENDELDTRDPARLAERTLRRRAVEAVIWGMPAVNYELLYQAMVRDAKGAMNQVVYWSRLPDWKNQTLTPNPDTVYLFPFFDMREVGPVVLEIPPTDDGSLTGTIMDAWQAALEDVGPAGADKGGGGRYLILPPGYTKPIPSGYFVLRSDTYRGYAVLRSNLQSSAEADVARAVAYGKRAKLYPLARAANPPETTFVDAIGVVYDSTIPYDLRFFQALDRFVQTEPWLERDKAMVDQLRAIGIERGRRFIPDSRTKEVLDEAAREAHAWLETRYQTAFSAPYYRGSHWAVPAAPEVIEGQASFYAKPGVYPVDSRGLVFSYAFFSPKHLGAGQFYLMTIRDKAGLPLDGSNTYRLTVPANAPAKLYWSVTVYDRNSHAFIRNLTRSSRSSLAAEMQKNSDGSVDVHFGPKPPEGKASNWIPTWPGREFEVLFRFYGPANAVFDKTWQLPDIELAQKAPALLETDTERPEQQAYEIAKDAYIYAYPLVLEDMTIRQFTNHAEPTGIPGQGPFNRFGHSLAFPAADFKTVVRPNVDTLYSVAHLDLGPEPFVLSVPATDRYFMLMMSSLWTDVFAVPGTRTTGRNTAREFLVVGPNWQGVAPHGLEILRSPTRIVWIGGRTQTNGSADYENVYRIQRGYKLTPLSAWHRGDYTPPKGSVDPAIDMVTPPPVQVERMDGAAFFARFAELLLDNPPGPFDYPMIQRLEQVGFKVGQRFDLKTAPLAIQRAFERATAEGKSQIRSSGKKVGGEGTRGWTYTLGGGAYGVDYGLRAAIASFGLGMNLPHDAVYPSITADGAGRPLDGNRSYVLHFDRDELPPVNAFWSLTAYDPDGYFIPNPLRRQALGDRDPLKFNADGSLDLYIQADSPGSDKAANWLPVTKAPFNLLMRLYWPKRTVLDGTWRPPPVRPRRSKALTLRDVGGLLKRLRRRKIARSSGISN